MAQGKSGGKARKQYGALPYLYLGGKLRVVLITSRTSKSWIFPKGRRIPGMSRPEGALQEAREEAGVVGRRCGGMKMRGIIDHPDGRIDLTLYPMRVETLRKRWPEVHERRRAVVSVRRAEKMLTFKTSRRMLRTWARKHRKAPGKRV
ncbi:NUDIX hydrolase [Pseudodonghicola flavimaris]|uniref:NUDIX domain-containing protein n=1 Tax=Pseudodonghicola flavimaris TaxID=3050036 RepID=A0ABT7F137_9RHOB|nr:NUDIX domain-containing protein [Pseudodonghicola flavimaris]MDK3018321.1 NUDIX domain-containing protein [Pseudodonghicola flavimaris]